MCKPFRLSRYQFVAWLCLVCFIGIVGCGSEDTFSVESTAQGFLEKAKLALDAKDYDLALEHLSRAEEKGLASAELYFLRGNAYMARGELALAEQAYLEALAIDPSHADAQSNLGVLYYRQGQYERAEERFRQALRSRPDDAEICYNLGGVLAAEGRLEQALEQFMRAKELDPSLAEPYLGLGNIYALMGRREQAIAALQEFLKRSRDPEWTRRAQEMLSSLGGNR